MLGGHGRVLRGPWVCIQTDVPWGSAKWARGKAPGGTQLWDTVCLRRGSDCSERPPGGG